MSGLSTVWSKLREEYRKEGVTVQGHFTIQERRRQLILTYHPRSHAPTTNRGQDTIMQKIKSRVSVSRSPISGLYSCFDRGGNSISRLAAGAKRH
jgi:hypothetical protein